MRYKQVIMLLLSTIILAGCPKSMQLEQMGVIIARGVDIAEEEKIEVALAIFQFEAQSPNIAKVVTGKGNTTKGAIKNANYETNFRLDSGKLQLELYGRKAAEKGISPYLDTLNRDSHIPNTMYLAVSDTTAKEIIQIQESDISINIGQFLHGVIEENSNDHLFPKINLAKFTRIQYDVGIDPILPLFTIMNNVPKITGIAVFRNDTLVGDIPISNKVLLNIMDKRVRKERMEVSLPLEPLQKYLRNKNDKEGGELHTAYNILNNRAKTTLIDKENLIFKTNIDLDVSLLEISEAYDITTHQNLSALEKELEKKLVSRYESLLEKLQNLNADPIGYGSIYRMHQKDGKLKESEWRDKFPNIKVEFDINANIIQHGEIQ